MAETANIARTNCDQITGELPDDRRLRREAKAMAVVRAYRPPEPPAPKWIPYKAPSPDATFTYYGYPLGTRITRSIVYFMYSGGRVKIGVSNGLRNRHANLKKAGAFPPTLLLVLDGTEKDERKLHAKFADDRLHGEWFRLSTKLRTFISYRLCDVGRASLDAVEREFRGICTEYLENYRPPKQRAPRQLCPHSVPTNSPCHECTRDLHLSILADLRKDKGL